MSSRVASGKSRTVGVAVVGLAVASLAGCSGRPGRVSPPDVDADSAAAAALAEYDRDGDSQLKGEELAACPALAHALIVYDADKDDALSQQEIAAGINRWSTGKMGAISLPFRITLDGRALGGAEVKLIPEALLDGAVKPAGGVANAGGSGFLGMSAEDRPSNLPNLPLVQPGLFRVEITHPSRNVPAKFNVDTTLGLETAVASQNPAGIEWSLRSK